MSMKKILMAAAAVTALTAGSANAIVIANTTEVGSITGTLGTTGSVITLAPGAGGTVTSDPYTLANEITTPATTTVTAVIKSTLTTPLAAATQYLVTYEITNGTFVTTGVLPLSAQLSKIGGTNPFASIDSTGTVSTSKIQFVFTTGAVADVAGISWKTQGIKPLSTKAPVTITTSIATAALPTINIDGGTSPALTLIDFRDTVSFKATAASPKLSIASEFKKFVSSGDDTTYADLGTAIGVVVAPATTAGGATDVSYKDGAGSPLATADVATAVITASGDFTKLDGRLGAAQLADTGTSNVFTADGTNLGTIRSGTATFGLVNKTVALAGNEGSYSITPVITLSTGLTAPTFTAKVIGSLAYQGNTFYAAWLADGVSSSGFKNTIRLGNRSTTKTVSSVKVQLTNPSVPATTGGSTTTSGTCELGTIKPAEEMLITSAKLVGCFGAFGRSDVKVIVQGAKSDLSAKLRITSPDGSASDTAMGTGISDALEVYTANGF